jgi:hypothetical protein
VSISSGANNKPSPIAIPHTASDQLLFITIAENNDPKIMIIPKVVVIRDFQILDIGVVWSRDFWSFFFLCCGLFWGGGVEAGISGLSVIFFSQNINFFL